MEDEGYVVRVIELGNRPLILTRARKNAPQAAKAIGELLELRQIGDMGVVMLDWDNELKGMPDEVAMPVIYISATKFFPGTELNLTVESRINVDEVFTQDELTSSILMDVVNELNEKMKSEIAQKEIK